MLVDLSALYYPATAFHPAFHSFLLTYIHVHNDAASVISERKQTLRDLHTVETPVTDQAKCWSFTGANRLREIKRLLHDGEKIRILCSSGKNNFSRVSTANE